MARTRGNGEGSVFMSATRGWCASITDLDGRRIMRKAPIQTKAGAEKLLRQLLRERDEGAVARRSMTIERYVPEWLEACKLRGCRPRTLEAYEERLRVHVLPSLGKVRLDKLSAAQVERIYTGLVAAGQSPKSIELLHTAFTGLVKHAKRRGIVSRNVLELVERPKVTRFKARPLTIDEARQLRVAVKDHPLGALWTFLLGTGCRFGEAAGLTWDAVGFKADVVAICQAAVRERRNGKSRIVLSPTKTDAGNRTVPLLPWVLDALKAQRARVAEMRLAAGPVWEDNALVFPSSRGTPLREAHVRERWVVMLKRCSLPENVRMHDLRHTFATIMLDNGEDLVAVQRTLRHSRLNITADLYIGRVPSAQKRAVERYGELLAADGT